MTHNSLSRYLVYSLLHCQTIVQILHRFTVTVNNIEVTVNTCTCTDVFTIITTKDQSGGIYNNYSTGGQGFMAVSKQTSSSGTGKFVPQRRLEASN